MPCSIIFFSFPFSDSLQYFHQTPYMFFHILSASAVQAPSSILNMYRRGGFERDCLAKGSWVVSHSCGDGRLPQPVVGVTVSACAEGSRRVRINVRNSDPGGYGDATATYIRRAMVSSRMYAKHQYNTTHVSECGNT